MPFEPRLIYRDDEPEPALSLPADLAELAEQLSEEAQSLATQYPAGNRRQVPQKSAVPWFGWLGTAAAVLVSLGIWGISRVETAPRATLRGPSVARAVTRRVHAQAIGDVGSSSAAAFFENLSGPEREGLLDLLEEQAPDQSTLSI